MKDVFNLTKVLIKNSFQKNENKKNSKLGKVGKIIIYILLYAYISGIVAYMSYQVLNVLIPVKSEYLFLKVIFGSTVLLIMFRTLFSALNVLYFSKDLEYILPLPIKSKKILMAKCNILIFSHYLVMLPFLLPALIVYGVMFHVGALYYLYLLLVFLLFPIVPTMFIVTCLIIVMRFTDVIKNKDFVQYITVALTLIFIITMQFTGMNTQELDNTEILAIMKKADTIIGNATRIFGTIKMSAITLNEYYDLNGLIFFVGLVVSSFIIYHVFILAASRAYLVSATKSLSNGIKQNKKINEKIYLKSSIKRAYVSKEFRNLIRNPIFFMQCILPPVIFPIIMSLPIFMQIYGDEPIPEEYIPTITEISTNPSILGLALGVLCFLFLFNFISATAISRDAENATIMKYLPIELEKQILYKIYPGIIMNIFPILYVIILLAIVLKVKIYILLELFIMSTLLNILLNYIGIIIDLKRPKLNWTSEYNVVKQNMNIFYFMIFSLIEIGILFLIAFKIQNVGLYFGIITIVLGAQLFFIINYIKKNINSLFEKIY